MSEKKVIAALSLDARLLYERLKKTEIGDVVSYEEMTSLVGRNVQNGGRGLIQTARKKALREDYFVFGIIRNEGLKRLSDLEIVATGEDSVQRVRRASKKGFQVITAVRDFNALPNQTKILHNTFASVLGAVAMATTSPQLKRLEKKVAEAKATLSLSATLQAFKD